MICKSNDFIFLYKMAIKRNTTLKYHEFTSFYKNCVKKPYLNECNDMKIICKKLDDISPGISNTASANNIIKSIYLD